MEEDLEERANMLMAITDSKYSKEVILSLLKHHPNKEDDNALVDEIFNGIDPSTWLSDDSDISEMSSEDQEIPEVIPINPAKELGEVSIDYDDNQIPNKQEEKIKNESIALRVIEFLGDMYPYDKVLEIVEHHPNKEVIEDVMETVLENLNLMTVSGDWLKNNKNVDVKEEEEESSIEKLEEIIIEEPIKQDERIKYTRANASELLATDEQRDLALKIQETMNYDNLDVILCVLRHHPIPKLDEVMATLRKGINEDDWFDRDKELFEKLEREDCDICYMDSRKDEMFTIHCESKHRYCEECVARYITIAIDEGNIPVCPGKGCDHILTENEVQQVLGTFSKVSEKYSRLLLREGLMHIDNCVGCPTPGCDNWLVLPENANTVKTQCYCELCDTAFCSLCKELYHYRVSCDQMKEFTAKWLRWCDQRQANLEKLNEVRNIKNRISELQKDEEWKASHLRCCPRCKRAIEKLEGCDSMKCGEDYHGGNKQKGCGKRFQWSKAEAYIPQEQQLSHLLNKPMAMKRNEIQEDHGEYLNCDVCVKRLFGIRFNCLHCPFFNVCEQCEPTLKHLPGHVFEVIGIEFIFEQEKAATPSVYERIRKRVSKRKNQILRAFQRSNPENEEGHKL